MSGSRGRREPGRRPSPRVLQRGGPRRPPSTELGGRGSNSAAGAATSLPEHDNRSRSAPAGLQDTHLTVRIPATLIHSPFSGPGAQSRSLTPGMSACTNKFQLLTGTEFSNSSPEKRSSEKRAQILSRHWVGGYQHPPELQSGTWSTGCAAVSGAERDGAGPGCCPPIR